MKGDRICKESGFFLANNMKHFQAAKTKTTNEQSFVRTQTRNADMESGPRPVSVCVTASETVLAGKNGPNGVDRNSISDLT